MTLRTLLRVVLGLVLGVALVAGGAVLFLSTHAPSVRPAPEVTVERTPERVERGRYLFHHVSLCAHCHTEKDASAWGLPLTGELASGQCPPPAWDADRPCTPNITPHPEKGVGGWRDGELLRAIREGVNREGAPLIPMMPYAALRHLSDEDAQALVAYLRTLPPSAREVRVERPGPPESWILTFFPEPVEGPVPPPPPGDRIARGRYLTQIGLCGSCHTGDAELAGGVPVDGPSGPEFSANLTPDAATGMGGLTREQFISRFKAWEGVQPAAASGGPVRGGMPWLAYAGMTAEDLGAIYDYLKTIPAVRNPVTRFPPPGAAP